MVLDDTRKILNILKGEYPQSFKNMTANEMALKLNVWQKVLEPFPYNLVEQAVLDIITNCRREYAPQVADIVADVRAQIEPDADILANQAWTELRGFLRSMSQDRHIDQQKFDALDDITKEILTYDQLRQMSQSDSKDIEFKWPWFMKRYVSIAGRKNDRLIREGKLEELAGTPQWQMLETNNSQKGD